MTFQELVRSFDDVLSPLVNKAQADRALKLEQKLREEGLARQKEFAKFQNQIAADRELNRETRLLGREKAERERIAAEQKNLAFGYLDLQGEAEDALALVQQSMQLSDDEMRIIAVSAAKKAGASEEELKKIAKDARNLFPSPGADSVIKDPEVLSSALEYHTQLIAEAAQTKSQSADVAAAYQLYEGRQRAANQVLRNVRLTKDILDEYKSMNEPPSSIINPAPNSRKRTSFEDVIAGLIEENPQPPQKPLQLPDNIPGAPSQDGPAMWTSGADLVPQENSMTLLDVLNPIPWWRPSAMPPIKKSQPQRGDISFEEAKQILNRRIDELEDVPVIPIPSGYNRMEDVPVIPVFGRLNGTTPEQRAVNPFLR